MDGLSPEPKKQKVMKTAATCGTSVRQTTLTDFYSKRTSDVTSDPAVHQEVIDLTSSMQTKSSCIHTASSR